ncbi:MAG: alpha/beta fold hydrolase [Gemmatimonas sp.]|uniref:alpha/beta fold hydrolase n=1 Tax=Gemmatimonas sp. TaxID=1962908 RepID=UPI0022C9052D|nr:alpha/beta fold hydrolase [Gemmatimonas sp.]MCE2953016.1 alpha/beta hydrolase [Gemmatimonas sp.]MCZ8011731.1 alpha/beta hydrolase [Gemmatimonas sp.]MCZ8265720.1 alpha/beta hydrolase [Gemmatimonas sp.]
MNALFFGSSDAPLYGVYHPPKARSGRRTGIVLCAPFGQEYMRSHRAFRQLALMLAKAGYHVFRFDYRGTGDSWGEGDAFTLEGAVADTGLAMEELRDTADVSEITLVGLRLGATVAALAAQEADDLSHLVLWDPVVDGPSYAGSLVGSAHHGESGATARAPSGVSPSGVPSSGTVHAMGFPVGTALREELMSLRLPGPLRHGGQTLVVLPDDGPGTDEVMRPWQGDGAPSAERAVVPVSGRWDEVDNWGSAMIPQNAIRFIVDWIQNRAR